MHVERIDIAGIPALVWGPPSDKVYLYVHGKMSAKESAAGLAQLAAKRGWQTISFDLPQHGERQEEPRRCDIWNGMEDLARVGDYVFARWKEVALYACSLGAYFSLHAYRNRSFSRCLFQSPIVDMPYLIRQMFLWFGVTEERLAAEKEIDTPVDALRWDYYQYVQAHPVDRWASPTCILYGGKDNMQSLDVMQAFAQRFGCVLRVAEGCEHPFMAEGDGAVVEQWLRDEL